MTFAVKRISQGDKAESVREKGSSDGHPRKGPRPEQGEEATYPRPGQSTAGGGESMQRSQGANELTVLEKQNEGRGSECEVGSVGQPHGLW